MLAFDIDAKDIAATRATQQTGLDNTDEALAQCGVFNTPPVQSDDAGPPYAYTFEDIQTSIDEAFDLRRFLEVELNFDRVRVFYSGQGCHVYALDDDPEHRYTSQARVALADYIKEKGEIPIDRQVSTDDARVLRIPRSLHADVCRLVTELHSPDFDPRTDPRAIPGFLGGDPQSATPSDDIDPSTIWYAGKESTRGYRPVEGALIASGNPETPEGYDPRPMPQLGDHPVCESEFEAWRVLLRPHEHDQYAVEMLFRRGLDHYTDQDGNFDNTMYLDHVEEFAMAAAGGVDLHRAVEHPWVDVQRPGKVAVLYAASAIAMKHSPEYDVPAYKVDFDEDAKEALLGNVIAAFRHHPRAEELLWEAAEEQFSRTGIDKRGPPPGRPIIGSHHLPDGRKVYEMPLIHSSRHALGRSDHRSEIRSLIVDNCLFIPDELLKENIEEMFYDDGPTGETLREVYMEMLTTQQFEEFTHSAERVNEHIQQIKRANRQQKLYEDQRYPERLRCVLKAVKEAPTDLCMLDRWMTASKVLAALEWFQEQHPYDADDPNVPEDQRHDNIKDYEQHVVEDLDTPQGVTMFLKDHADHHAVEHVQREHPDADQYRLQYHENNFKQVDIDTVNDAFELPCLQHLEEYFMNNPPEREPLYFLVRILASLDNDFSQREIEAVFERFPWYDEQTTRYQVWYEMVERPKQMAEPPLPIGCQNDNNAAWNRFCIGMENCEYSIYNSLPMKDSVQNQVEES